MSLEVLVKFRNICAHDERLYCARVGGRKAVNYAKMVWMLERYLTKSEFLDFLTDFVSMIQLGERPCFRACSHPGRFSGNSK